MRQGTPAGPLLATYDYDHKGRRVRKSTMAAAPQGATTTLYLYDHADHLLVEADGAGNPGITYVWREDTPIALIRHGVSGNPIIPTCGNRIFPAHRSEGVRDGKGISGV
ncbi:hypothetical protein [Thauera sinica]|uniref:YD repeat-containing protein n=1 Tax=Thauera sinica TaxID=2665146 RepID=A0ABW1APR4_9RHOO|nr:hypothetical protein [Thauera sp. K11]ATE59502.1 hypothetical protein CCZ27_05640 [Thauera sp. K11]